MAAPAAIFAIKISLPDELTGGTIPNVTLRVEKNATVTAVMQLVAEQLNRKTLPGVITLDDLNDSYGVNVPDSPTNIFLSPETELLTLLPEEQRAGTIGKVSLCMARRPTAKAPVIKAPPKPVSPATVISIPLDDTKRTELDEEAEINKPRPMIGPAVGTVDELVDLMLMNKDAGTPWLPQEFRTVFLLNHVGFMESQELFTKLMAHYQKPVDAYQAPRLFFLAKIAIVETILEWAESYPEDLECVTEPGACQDFFHVMCTEDISIDHAVFGAAQQHGGNYKGLVDNLAHLKAKLGNLKKRMDKKGVSFIRTPPPPPTPAPQNLITVEDLQSSAVSAWTLPALMESGRAGLSKAIAEQLCLIDSVLLGNVKLREFTNKEWTRKDKLEKAPNVVRMTDVFNTRSYWVSTAVLLPESPAERANVLRLFIKVGNQCLKLRNYYAAFAIYIGLIPSFITRLTQTWSKVSADVKARFEKLKAFCSTDNSTMIYRKELRRGELRKLPQLPNLVVMLDDLFKLEEIASRGENNVVNWHKYAKQYNTQAIFSNWELHPGYVTLQGDVVVRKAIEAGMSGAKTIEELWDLSFKQEQKSEAHAFQLLWKRASPEEKDNIWVEQKSLVNSLFVPIEEARRARAEREKIRLEEELAARLLRVERGRQREAEIARQRLEREEQERQRRLAEDAELKERAEKEVLRLAEELAAGKAREEKEALKRQEDEERIRPALEQLKVIERLRAAEGKVGEARFGGDEDQKLATRLSFLSQGVMATKLVHGNFGKEHAVHLRVVKVQNINQQNLSVSDPPSKKAEKMKEKERIVSFKAEGEWRITWNTAKLTPSKKISVSLNASPGWIRVRDLAICLGNETDLFTEKRYARYNKAECCVTLISSSSKGKKSGLNLVFETKAIRDRWIEALQTVNLLACNESTHMPLRGSSPGSPEASLNKASDELSMLENIEATRISLDGESDEDMMLVQAEALEVTSLGGLTLNGLTPLEDPPDYHNV